MKYFPKIIIKHYLPLRQVFRLRFSASNLSKKEQYFLQDFVDFSMTANVMCTVEQRSQTFYETHIAHRLALIQSTCSSSLRFELQIAHALQTRQLRYLFKNFIFRYCYVIQKASVLLKLSNFTVQSFSLHPLLINPPNQSRIKG